MYVVGSPDIIYAGGMIGEGGAEMGHVKKRQARHERSKRVRERESWNYMK